MDLLIAFIKEIIMVTICMILSALIVFGIKKVPKITFAIVIMILILITTIINYI